MKSLLLRKLFGYFLEISARKPNKSIRKLIILSSFNSIIIAGRMSKLDTQKIREDKKLMKEL